MASFLRGPWPRLRIPRPKAFLGIMSLLTGSELICLSLVFNKLTGVYGLLAILTGFALSALQLSIYLCNLLVLILLAVWIPHIRKQSPFENLALAWLYLLDTTINVAYTTAFAVNWYLSTGKPATPKPGAEGEGGDAADDGGNGQEWIGAHETAASLVLIVIFTTVRLYFALIIMSYTRHVLDRYAENQSSEWAGAGGDEADKAAASRNPFAPGAPAGEGWRGKAGRALVYVGKDYWLGRKEDDEWARSANAKFHSVPTADPDAAEAEAEA